MRLGLAVSVLVLFGTVQERPQRAGLEPQLQITNRAELQRAYIHRLGKRGGCQPLMQSYCAALS
jgi:hypothetical protein